MLSVDEKIQCQALERTQPVLPMGLGYVEGIAHDYATHESGDSARIVRLGRRPQTQDR